MVVKQNAEKHLKFIKSIYLNAQTKKTAPVSKGGLSVKLVMLRQRIR